MSVVPRRKASPPYSAGHVRAPLRSLADVLSVGAAATQPAAPKRAPTVEVLPVAGASPPPTTDPFPWYPQWKKKQEELLAKGRKDGEQINKRLQGELQLYKNTIYQLQKALDDQIEKEMDARDAEILKSDQELAEQKLKLEALVTEVAGLKAELKSKSDALTIAQKDALKKVEDPALKQQISVLQQEIRLLEQSKTDDIKVLNDKIKILESYKARKEIEVKSLQEAVREMEAELKDMEAESSSEKKALQQELLKYKGDLAKAERVASELQSSVETANNLFLTEQRRMAAVSDLVKKEIVALKGIIKEVSTPPPDDPNDGYVPFEGSTAYELFDDAPPAPEKPLDRQLSADL